MVKGRGYSFTVSHLVQSIFHLFRFRDLSPRLEGRQFTPEWDRRRSPSRFDGPEQRFVEPIERYPDGSRMLPLHPSERRFVQTARITPESEWRGRYSSPRREFREVYTDQRSFR